MALGTPYTVLAGVETIASGTTWQVPITAGVAFGDALVVSAFDNQTAITGVTDSAGNTYTLVQNESGNALHTFQFLALNCAAMTVANADWIKLTFNAIASTSQIGFIVRGCSGVVAASATDAAGTVQAFGSSTTPAVTGATTLAQAAEWIVSALQASNAATGVTSWGGGFTQASLQHGSGQPYCAVADQIVAATTAVNASAVLPVSATWAMQQVALKGAVSAGSGIGTPYTAVTASEAVSSGTTYQVTLTHDVAAHDALVLTGLDSLTTVTGVTDSKGNSWVQTTSVGATGLATKQFAAVDCAAMASGTDWIKITFGALTSAAEVGFTVRGCSGIAGTAAVDSGSTITKSGTSASPALAGTAGLAQVPEWIVAGVSSANASGGPTGAWGGGFTQRQQEHQTGQPYLTVADQVVTTGGSGGRAARLIGFDVVKGTWADANSAIGPGQTHRIFYGGSLPSTFDGDGTPDSVCLHASYRTQMTAAGIAAYINSIPAARSEVWLIFNHEPENGDFANGAAFVTAFKAQANLVHAVGNPRVKMCMAAMAYQYGAGANNTDAQAGNYVRGLGNGYADVLTCDVYQGSGGTTASWDWSGNGLQNLDHWVNWLKVVTDKSIVGTIVPLGITEYGLDHAPGVYDDATVNARLNTRMGVDRDYLINAFQGTAPISPFPLQCWCYWWIDRQVSPPDPNQPKFTDATMIATWQAIENASGSSVVNASVGLTSSGAWAMTQTALIGGVSAGGSVPVITTADLPAAEAGQAYSQTFAATGGTAPYTWAVTAGSLPDGLTLTSAGVLAGTPLNGGTSPFTVTATDAAAVTTSAPFTLVTAAALAVATGSLPGGSVGAAYSAQVSASGGTGALAWSVSVGTLPAGLTLNPATGMITGTPTGAGTSAFTVKATDSYTNATKALSIVVTGAVLQVTTNSLPGGTLNAAYSFTLAAANGTAPYTWATTGGSLPPGLTLSSGGVLSGTPTSPGTYTATFRVTDNVAATAFATLTISIVAVLESLVISGQIELLQGGVASTIPECAGATFLLAPGSDLSAPQNTAASTAAVYLDGERPVGRRASNRTISLLVKISVPMAGTTASGPERLTLAAAKEVLLTAIDHDWWELTWTRPGGLPVVFDCFRADPAAPGYDLISEQQLVAYVTISFAALPYGRSDTPVIAEFPAPLAGKTAPPPPVTIDNFATVTGTNWSQSLIGPGPNSAFWHSNTSGVGQTATYVRTGIGPFNLAGLGAVTFWCLLGSTAFFPFSGLKQKQLAKFTLTLTDGTRTISAHLTRRVRMTNNSYDPYPQKIRIAIPQGTLLNYAAVTGYSITISARTAGDLPYTDVYLDDVRAVPYATAGVIAPSAGAVYDLAGTVGSARSLASIQVQQPAGTVTAQVKRITKAGSGNWLCPAGVTSIDLVECYGAGGRGGLASSVADQGGGGGGEYAAAAGVAVTPGTVYAFTVGAGGKTGTGTGGSTTFPGDAVTVTAHGGTNVGDSATGGAGGTGSTNATHFNGGAGGNGAGGPDGGGGGGCAGPSGAGNPGAAGSGTGNGGGPGPGGTVAGPGGGGARPSIFGLASTAKNGLQAGGGGGGSVLNLAGGAPGNGADGEIVLTYKQTATFRTLVIHRPRSDAPDTLSPFVALDPTDAPNGGTEYPVVSLVAGSNARFDSTYTLVLVSKSWHNPGAARDLTVTVTHYEQAGGASYAQTTTPRTVTPNSLPSPLVVLGELTLPDHAMPDDNTAAYFTVKVNSTDLADRFQDILFLDTQGSTVMIESPTGYVWYGVDEPPIGREVGNIMGSSFDRSDAVSVLAYATVSGPPLYVDPIASCQALLLYAAEGAPSAELIYFSRWMLDRVI